MIFAASVQKRQERITPGGTGGALKNSLDQGDGGAGGNRSAELALIGLTLGERKASPGKEIRGGGETQIGWGDLLNVEWNQLMCKATMPRQPTWFDCGWRGYTVLAEAGERRKEEERKKEWGEKKETFVAQHRQGRKIGRVSGPPHGGSNGRGVSRGMGRKEGRRTTRDAEASGASHSHRQGWLLQIADRSGCRGWRGGHGGHEVDRGLQEVDGAEFAGALIPPIVPPIGIRASATADQRDDHQC